MVERMLDQRPALSMGAVSTRLGVSRRSISRDLDRAGLGSFTRLKRIAVAKRGRSLLAAIPIRSVKEIAFELGFGSASAFQHMFKSATGVPPSGPRGQNGHRSRGVVLALADRRDATASAVVAALAARKIHVVRLSASECRGRLGGAIDFSEGGMAARLKGAGGSVDLNSVCTVWNWRPNGARAAPGAGGEFAASEAKAFLLGLFELLRAARWVSPYCAQSAAERKPYQLRVAQECGLRVPKTLITNDPRACLKFFDECGGAMIYKPLSFYRREVGPGRMDAIYTNRVQRADLIRRRDQVRAAPCIFQEFIPKRAELRVTVMGDQVFTVEIDARASPAGRVDWRHYDMAKTKWCRCELPPAVADSVHRLMRRLGLAFGCLDLVVSPSGEVTFLEINPAGQWLWLEPLTGLPLLDAFANFLASPAPCLGK
ncbi:MAG: helix-turn-helix domain-containing protein [Terriglobales bacterium]